MFSISNSHRSPEIIPYDIAPSARILIIDTHLFIVGALLPEPAAARTSSSCHHRPLAALLPWHGSARCLAQARRGGAVDRRHRRHLHRQSLHRSHATFPPHTRTLSTCCMLRLALTRLVRRRPPCLCTSAGRSGCSMRCGMRWTRSARPSSARAPSSASSVQSSSRELSANAVPQAKRLPRELRRQRRRRAPSPRAGSPLRRRRCHRSQRGDSHRSPSRLMAVGG